MVVRSIAIDPQKPRVVYFGTDDLELSKSTDGGDTWSPMPPAGAGGDGPNGNLLMVDPDVPSHVYVAGQGYFGESIDGGRTWGAPPRI